MSAYQKLRKKEIKKERRKGKTFEKSVGEVILIQPGLMKQGKDFWSKPGRTHRRSTLKSFVMESLV